MAFPDENRVIWVFLLPWLKLDYMSLLTLNTVIPVGWLDFDKWLIKH